MRKNYRDLQDKLPPDVRTRAAETARRIEQAQLDELRRSRKMTQQEIAQRMGTGQANVSKLERRSDMHVSTLQTLIRALGGELEIIARFPEGDVRITQFEPLQEACGPDLV